MLDIRANLKQLQTYTYAGFSLLLLLVLSRSAAWVFTTRLYHPRMWGRRSEKYRNNCDWNKACFSGGGKYVIGGSATGAVNVWETASGKLVSGTRVSSLTLSERRHRPLTVVYVVSVQPRPTRSTPT
jgi:hypothetical protein